MIMLQALEGPVLFTQVFKGGAVPEHPVPGGPGPLVSDADLRALAAGRREPFFTERDYMGSRLRVYARRPARPRGRRRPPAERDAEHPRARCASASAS